MRQAAKAGTATFTPVAPGAYQLAAWADGKARTLQWTQVGVGDTTERLVLVAGAKVTGRVVDTAGYGLANATVTFHGALKPGSSKEGKTWRASAGSNWVTETSFARYSPLRPSS